MLSQLNCPYIQTSAGFDESVLPTNSVTVSGSTGADIQAAINSLPASGGFVDIPAGTYSVTSDIVLNDNVYLRGAGIDQTILVSNSGTHVVYKKHGANMGVSDMTINANNNATRGIFFWYADNVYTDRVKVYDSTRNNIQYRYVSVGAIQNSETYGAGTSNGSGHGIVSDDNQSSDHTAAGALAEFNSDFQGYGALWTNNVLIANNYAHDNGDYGIDWHGDDSEIACNILEDNFTGGAKTQDADGLWFHHNTFISNGGLDYRISAEYQGSAPGALAPNVIWANDFTQESDATIRFNAPTTNTYLVCNTYATDGEILVESGATVFVTESDPADSALFDDEVPGGSGLSVSSTYDFLKDAQVNQPPTISCSNQSSIVGTPDNYTPAASDPDNDTLTFGASGLPSGVTINASTGEMSGTPDSAGTSTVTVTVDDGNGGTDSCTFDWITSEANEVCEDTLNFTFIVPAVIEPPDDCENPCLCIVFPENGVPVISDIPDQTLLSGSPASIPVNVTDPDDEGVDCDATGLPPGMSFNFGDITGVPSQTGVFNVSVTCTDQNGDSDTETFVLTVTDTLERWYVNATAAPGSGDGTSIAPWHDFDEVDWTAVDASGDRTIFVAGGASPTSRYTYNESLDIPISNVTVDFAGYSEMVGGWGDNPLPGCADAITPTPGPQVPGIRISGSNVTVSAQNTVGLQLRSWTYAGIDLLRTSSNANLSNIEVFNNGIGDSRDEWDFDNPQRDCNGNDYPTYSGAAVAYPNYPGIWVGGPNHVFDGVVVHDNGQDAIQSRDEGTSSSGGNNLANLTIRNSWLYNGREYTGPAWPNGGPIQPNGSGNVESSNYCTHTDGLQIFANADAGRDLQGTMSGVTIEDTWIGPGLSNNLILGEVNRVDVSNVSLNNVVLDRGLDNNFLVNSGSVMNNLSWQNVTSYAGEQTKEHHLEAINGTTNVSINNSITSGDGIYPCADVNFFGSTAPTVNNSTADTDVALNTNAGAWNVSAITFADTSGGAMGVYNDYTTATTGGANDTTVGAMIGATVSGTPDQFGSYSIV